ncbi:protein tantalus [Musca domestica]|uniref:Protein tantalus n=1 Tax=Musca domestica TaxID=7370 RepID=A0A9J7D210_MUSDO|nr:protein tantalus [Musca domestica]
MMEGIVCGIANINFKQNTGNYSDENCIPNFMQNNEETTKMALICAAEQASSTSFNPHQQPDEDECSNDEEEDNDVPDVGRNRKNARLRRNSIGATFAERRQMPSRSSKENHSSIKRRTIMKPARHTSSLNKDFGNLKPAEIKKIYLNKKITNFRPASLETIFEEPDPSCGGDGDNNTDGTGEYEQVRFIGARKLRRVLACSDGFVFNKALIKKRRAKIKKAFGRRLSLKKISLEDFLVKLNNSMEDDEEGDNSESSCKTPQEMEGAAPAAMQFCIPENNLETDAMDAMPIVTTTTTTTPTQPTTSSASANDVNAFSFMPQQMASSSFLPNTGILP